MGRNNYFQFKHFKIIQEQSAFKVGTDGILLGAWADISNTKTVLDIGTGTGLIALMLAQRSNAVIFAVEIDKVSFNEASFNFNQSIWNNRLKALNISFQDFTDSYENKFDLIISNPPYFENDLKSMDPVRSNARHNELLPYHELIDGVNKLLSETGKFILILPNKESDKFLNLAEKMGLFLSRLTKVKAKPGSTVKRHLMELKKTKLPVIETELTIETAKHLDYSTEYKLLTKKFYLAF